MVCGEKLHADFVFIINLASGNKTIIINSWHLHGLSSSTVQMQPINIYKLMAFALSLFHHWRMFILIELLHLLVPTWLNPPPPLFPAIDCDVACIR